MEQVILWILGVGAVIGGIDRLAGNRFGLGEKFEEGFGLLGQTALSMAGILCLAPLLSDGLETVLAPIFRAVGLDPAMLGGVIAIDMGGYQTAAALAQNAAVGRYAGILSAATLGCTVCFVIPLGAGMLKEEDKTAFFKGISIGLGVMPIALAAGGVAGGMEIFTLLVQTLPIILCSVLLMLGLQLFPRGTVKAFTLFSKLLQAASTVGLTLGAFQYITGFRLIAKLTPLEEAMKTVSAIGIVMLGSLPTAELLRRALSKPFNHIGKKLGMRDCSLAALLIGCVSAVPALAVLKDMDDRGQTVNAAFLVCAASALAAHLGFTLSVEPNMAVPLLLTKFLGGFCGIAAALLLTGKAGRRRKGQRSRIGNQSVVEGKTHIK